jgi:uncharacterized protein YodC (DUF2158 family)
MSTFRVGDTVQLVSGGEMMTVVGVQGDNVTCTVIRNEVFNAVRLRKISPRGGRAPKVYFS